MKKIVLYITISLSALSLVSCDKDPKVWDSETLEYAGQWMYRLMSEDMTAVYAGYNFEAPLYIYNTSANKANEVWIDDHDAVIGLKSKFFFTGSAAGFGSKDTDYDNLPLNLFYGYEAGDITPAVPTSAGLTSTVEGWYFKSRIDEGKILRRAATTPGGNTADSIYMKITLFSGDVTFESYQTPQDTWSGSTPEYDWKVKSIDYVPAYDETYVISGFHYTGFPEDDVQE